MGKKKRELKRRRKKYRRENPLLPPLPHLEAETSQQTKGRCTQNGPERTDIGERCSAPLVLDAGVNRNTDGSGRKRWREDYRLGKDESITDARSLRFDGGNACAGRARGKHTSLMWMQRTDGRTDGWVQDPCMGERKRDKANSKLKEGEKKTRTDEEQGEDKLKESKKGKAEDDEKDTHGVVSDDERLHGDEVVECGAGADELVVVVVEVLGGRAVVEEVLELEDDLGDEKLKLELEETDEKPETRGSPIHPIPQQWLP
ncbi:hypothetical protein GALMADRAFT_207514 [Galerina marginata CBS 339.88]|uniref:Uncharacterized protein n=1 Tax=Galerina marginata (strain CBS 339.88) TaxID=685588 RepID=A0A067TTA7_GALM3|nr:hypothetical protein GALMADRAFT_207514 [Galerina marginata CBS 339.88]